MPPLPATSTVPTSAGTVEFAESFTWDFPVKVDAILSLKDQCDKPIAALDEAIGDATAARGMVEHQRARLVETVVEHLTNVISAAEHALSCFHSLKSALEDYGGAVKPIRTEFEAIITDASGAGLTVSQDGTQVTISHPANIPGGLGAFFASLRSRCEINQRKFAYAEKLFGDALAGIDPTVWESTLLPVFNKFVETYGFPTGLNARARLPGWVDTMRNTVADGIESVYLQAKGAKYQAPAGLKDASPWKQITERGNLKNWKVPGGGRRQGRQPSDQDRRRIAHWRQSRRPRLRGPRRSRQRLRQLPVGLLPPPGNGTGREGSEGRLDRSVGCWRRIRRSQRRSTTRRSHRRIRRPRRYSRRRNYRWSRRRTHRQQNWPRNSNKNQ